MKLIGLCGAKYTCDFKRVCAGCVGVRGKTFFANKGAFVIVRSLSELPDFSSYRILVLDTETSGLRPHHGDRIAGICIGALKDDREFYIPIRHPDGNLPAQAVLSWLRDLCADPSRTWVGHNLKFDLGMLRADKIEIAGRVLDTMIAGHVFNGSLLSYELDALTKYFVVGFEHVENAKLKAWLKMNHPEFYTNSEDGTSGWNYSLIPAEIIEPYGCEDIRATRALAKVFDERAGELPAAIENFGCKAQSGLELLASDMSLAKVLFEMEWTGVPIDFEKAAFLEDKTRDEIECLMQKLERLAGFSFSPAAWTKMGKAFEAAGGTVRYFTKKKEFRGKQAAQQITEDESQSTGRPNWNAYSILQYIKEFTETGNTTALSFIKTYRDVMLRERMQTVCLEKFIKYRDSSGMLHGQFHQHRVNTGRLSSGDPLNLQAIPKVVGTQSQGAVEEFLGEKDDEALNRKMRQCIKARDGNVLVSVDYQQLEYKTAAFFARDEVMFKKYQEDPKTDYHQATIDMIKDLRGFTLERNLIKTLNFMVLFGGGATGVAATLSGMGKLTTKGEAQQLLNTLYEARPALLRLIKDQTQLAKRQGFIQNPFGRIVLVPQGFEYRALNYLVQGTAGDQMRRCLVNVAAYIKKEQLPVQMLLTIHDEIVYEMPVRVVKELTPKLCGIMTECPFMDIPLTVDAEVGFNWGEQVKLDE